MHQKIRLIRVFICLLLAMNHPVYFTEILCLVNNIVFRTKQGPKQIESNPAFRDFFLVDLLRGTYVQLDEVI